LRPTQKIFTSLPAANSELARSRTSRTICELNGPHRPRSAVHTMSRCTWSRPLPANSRGAVSEPATLAAILRSTVSMRSA
jgi:hypothetical protein